MPEPNFKDSKEQSDSAKKQHDPNVGVNYTSAGESSTLKSRPLPNAVEQATGSRYRRYRSLKSLTILLERFINDIIRGDVPKYVDPNVLIRAVNTQKEVILGEEGKKITMDQYITKSAIPSIEEILAKNPPEVNNDIIDKYSDELKEKYAKHKKKVDMTQIISQ